VSTARVSSRRGQTKKQRNKGSNMWFVLGVGRRGILGDVSVGVADQQQATGTRSLM
jgi:hypothetical protein